MASRRDEQRPQETKPLQERVVVVGLITGSTPEELEEADRSLDELGELALAAGAVVVGRISQRRPAPDPATVLGKGKIDELAAACAALTADTVIFDDELTGAQIRNISQITDCKVIDRTLLILDIFARRARSHEGKLQVEMAQLQYRLSHLTGFGRSLSRLGGGIGTRGPGETKLESDRRHINRRIATLRKALSDVAIR
ncbi:MAG: GTPase HflX, partial [Eubacteriales bacterium]|nr:GTPase HflX [Eubacteriales bacterium]